MASNQLHRPSDSDVIEAARLYSLNPQLIKARVFAHFEAGFSSGETCLVMKGQVKPRSIQTYYSLWKELSEDCETISQENTPAVYENGILSAKSQVEVDPTAELIEALTQWSRNGQESGPTADFVWMMTQWCRNGFRPGDRPLYRSELEMYDEIRALEVKVGDLTAQLASTNAHTHMGDIINHSNFACSGCRRDMLAYNQKVIKNGLENMDQETVRRLALIKGVLPGNITFEVP